MKLKTIAMLLLMSLMWFQTSCAHHGPTSHYKAKRSFVKMNVLIVMKKNVDGQSQSLKAQSVASGVGIDYDGETHVLTAAHVCDYSDVTDGAVAIGYEPEITITAIDIAGEKYKLKIVKTNPSEDLCLLSAIDGEELDIPEIRLSNFPPVVGAKYYNYAAPAGIFSIHTVPILEGYYTGKFLGLYAMYTIPVAGGSSGSPIVNENGNLVGLIHSVHRQFHHLSFSARYGELKKFVTSP